MSIWFQWELRVPWNECYQTEPSVKYIEIVTSDDLTINVLIIEADEPEVMIEKNPKKHKIIKGTSDEDTVNLKFDHKILL